MIRMMSMKVTLTEIIITRTIVIMKEVIIIMILRI